MLFGQQSSDADGAVLWAAVADRLRRPMVSQVAELTLEDGKVTGKRQTEFGYDVIAAPLPAVVAVSDAINEPRYPSLKGIMGAKSKPQEVVSLADVGVEAERVGEPGSRTTVRSSAPPPAKSDQVKIEDDGSAPEKIVEYLAGEAPRMSTLVYLEAHDGDLTKGGLGVLAKAVALGGDVAGVVLGSGVRDAAAKAGAYGAKTVYVVDDEALAAPLPQPRVDALEAVVGESGATNVLFPASVLAADVAAGLSARLDAGLNWDLTDLRLEGDELVGVRPALGDTVVVEVGWTPTPRLALIRSGTFDPVGDGRHRRGEGRLGDLPGLLHAGRRWSTTSRSSRAARRSRTRTSSSPAVGGSAGRRASPTARSSPQRSAARSPRRARSSTPAGTRTRPRWARPGRRSRRSSTSPSESPARSSTRSGCRARARSSRSTRIRTRRSSTSPTSASSAT